MFCLGAYSQYNPWNHNSHLIHEYVFFGGNHEDHNDIVKMAENDDDLTKMLNDPKGRKILQETGPDIFSLPRSLEARRPLISALGTDPETGELFEYNPMFGGKAKQKRCHKRIKVKDSKNQDHRKNKVI